MSTFYEKREIVAPGDLLAEGEYIAGENTYKEGSRIYASRLGLVEYGDKKIKVVALKGFYIPRVGDMVIGIIKEVSFNRWMVDIRSPYLAVLQAADVINRRFRPQTNDLPKVLEIGDLIIAKIASFDRSHDPRLTVREPGLGKINRGQVVDIVPTKIPRVIGRKGSMISMIKQETGCHITLGTNGRILITGKSIEDEQLAMVAIRKIEEESHTSGLTDRVAQMFKEEKANLKEENERESEN